MYLINRNIELNVGYLHYDILFVYNYMCMNQWYLLHMQKHC